jgi:hypothetical protein
MTARPFAAPIDGSFGHQASDRHFGHLTANDRQAIIEILRETKAEVAEVWPAE